ncbi:DUF302 domain-containing protein [Sedimenticola selenatireducens]|jgi:uncharacterized protein (DUF302 family)|uniref:DUF302 domain-containing protein n=1 Tax=Sedimenticola selenatireducens TaxID=191960 RepID=A0A557RTV8_9GAMM|nr:DUF302 domain-containing protein [Sedimenticola selenatireducens]TVO68561.1 DUF302 domain-containing protein [Sedimenticola selenatireducens]TVT66523.1 MAG: DUF302 domain-containing protein [Sedimenticola selenatireducens]
MRIIRNLFALIGLLTVIAVAVATLKTQAILDSFDPGAAGVYKELAENIIETRNAAEATIWKVPVEEGITPEDVEQSMKTVANELNISNVGELPLYKDVEAKSGEKYRFVKIYMFCNSLTAARMLDYSDAFSAYLPCRITMVEDKQGKLWLYALNMDLMIHGGEPLPPALKEEAVHVKNVILEIMRRGAIGDF